jgi:glutamine phosphoribosylpyrophosphate amidotransferase
MCGVIGYWPGPDCDLDLQGTMFERLMLESRVRGTHAFGICRDLEDRFDVLRSHSLPEILNHFDPAATTIAHARFSTSGDWQTLSNNQPIVAGGRALAFNGVIHMGTRAELETKYGVRLETENDGEVFLRLLESYGLIPTGSDQGTGAMESAEIVAALDIVNSLEGSFAGVWLRDGQLYAARNSRRPLWSGLYYGAIWFASTADIMMRAGFELDYIDEIGVLAPLCAQVESERAG